LGKGGKRGGRGGSEGGVLDNRLDALKKRTTFQAAGVFISDSKKKKRKNI